MKWRGGWACLALAVFAGCHDPGKAARADGELVLFPGLLDFQRVGVNDTTALSVTLRNVGRGRIGVEELRVESPSGVQYDAAFTDDAARLLIPSATSGLDVTFHPVQEGDFAGKLFIRSDDPAVPPLVVTMKGTGVDNAARLSSDHLDYGRIELGTTKTLPLTLKNPSDIPTEVVARAEGPHAGEFQIASVSLAPFEERTIDTVFAPTVVGVKDARYVITPCRGCADKIVTISAEGLDSALVAEPPVVDFGPVPIDRDSVLVSRVRNVSTEPATLTGFLIDSNTDASFTIGGQTLPVTLAPGQAQEVTIRYAPGHMGEAKGSIRWSARSVRNPEVRVQLLGFGGAPELCVAPSGYDFPTVPVGAKVGTELTIRNCGSNNSGGLTVTEIFFADEPYIPGNKEFNFQAPAMPFTLQPGQSVKVKVFFEPTQAGPAGAFLNVKTSGYSGSQARVGFNGNAEYTGACDLIITPAGGLDFGTVRPTHGAVLGIKVFNKGTNLCAVKNIQLTNDGGGKFTMPGGIIDGLLLYPQDKFSFQVAFVAPKDGAGEALGSLQIQQSDPGAPRIDIPLKAWMQDSCLVAEPGYLDFGVGRPDCPPPAETTRLTNTCGAPVDVTDIAIGAGTTDGEFVIKSISNGIPRTVQPGEKISVEVRYLAQVSGMNLSPLFITTSELPHPYLVTLLGESNDKMERTDRFTQQDGSKVDVLFVVDNTASMVEEQPKFINALPEFVNAAKAKAVDLHVAVTTTGIDPASNACPGGAQGGEAGRLFPADNSNQRVLTGAMGNLTAELQQNAAVGQCAYVEQAFEAMRRALTDPLVSRPDDPRTALPNDGNLGFLREEAGLAVVFVGDEDDRSGDDVDTYVRFLQTLKGASQPQRATMYAIAPTENSCATAGGTGNRYAQAVQKTGGEVLSICASDYGPLLRDVAGRAFNPQDTFPLSATPDGGLTVKVNGTTQTGGYTYDSGANSVIFSPIPDPGAKISITYKKACVR